MASKKRAENGNDPRTQHKGRFPFPNREMSSKSSPYSCYFGSWSDMVQFAKENSGRGNASSADTNRSGEWAGTKTFAEAEHLANNGWADGVAYAEPLCSQITAKITSLVEVEHVSYDVEGIGLDVATYLNGEPECWQRFEKQTGEGEGVRHIRIVFDCTASAGVNAKIMMARGAAVAALIQGLEFAGCRVQLEVLPVCCNSYRAGKKLETRVLVKAADQDLDMSRVIFAVANPAMLRRIGFALTESAPDFDCELGYGSPTKSDDKGDLYFDSAMLGEAQWDNVKSATEWALRKMVEQGIKLTDTK